MTRHLSECTIGELRSLLGRGEATAEEVRRACVAAVRSTESEIRAWTCLAEAPDKAAAPGPLHGIPIGIKDVYDTADLPTAYGSPIFAGHRPAADAEAVSRLRAAGALVLGKTATTEFAYFSAAATRNPLDLSRTPGGSSSGSAAAVAAGMVPAALGTQTAGSTIRPAAYCGVFGYKPSHGAAPLAGVKRLAPSLDTVGIFARSVDDLALVAEVISGGTISGAVQAPPAPPRLGFFRGPYWERVTPTVAASFTALADRLGAVSPARQLSCPPIFERLTEAQKLLMAREAAEEFADLISADSRRISEEFRQLCQTGAGVGDRQLQDIVASRAEGQRELDQLLGDDEVLLTPSALDEAPPLQKGTGDPLCNRLWTLLEVPCVSVPLFGAAGSLPHGIQVIARKGCDERALSVAKWLSQQLQISLPRHGAAATLGGRGDIHGN